MKITALYYITLLIFAGVSVISAFVYSPDLRQAKSASSDLNTAKYSIERQSPMQNQKAMVSNKLVYSVK